MPPDTQRFDAFISYSHNDETAARRIQNFLERYKLPKDVASGRRGLRVFRDATDIRTGQLSEELNSALDASRTLVVCCSPAAMKSEWVAQEIRRFLDHDANRPVVPVLLQGDAASSIPKQLRSFNHRFADLRSAWLAGRLKSQARDELIRALATISGVELRQLIHGRKGVVVGYFFPGERPRRSLHSPCRYGPSNITASSTSSQNSAPIR